jgi:hypothetical protein
VNAGIDGRREMVGALGKKMGPKCSSDESECIYADSTQDAGSARGFSFACSSLWS